MILYTIYYSIANVNHIGHTFSGNSHICRYIVV
nr:MAG TPA: hypothetical protein [Bacteriophage sp.]